jgi:beta-glucosidase
MKMVPVFAMVLLLLGCQGAPPEEGGGEEAPVTASQASLKRFDPQIDALLEAMTLEEKVGQMTQPDMSYLASEDDIANYQLGSVLNGGGSDPTPENTFEDWRDMAERYQAQAHSTRLKIPLLHGVDAVHGHANVVGAVVFPHNIGLGATRNADLVEKVYRATALEVRATGIHWNFAPCVAVARDIRWGRTYEAFSEDPGVATELGVAAVKGLQGEGLGDPNGVLACAKHWIADGGTTMGTGAPKEAVPDSVFAESGRAETADRWPLDRGDTQVDEATLRAIHMPPYIAAVEAGVGSIMPSFSSWNGEKLSGHKYLLTDVLKGELGFEGFLISDWAAIDDLPGDYASDIEQSINAGMDMVMVPDRYQEFYDTLKRLVEEGKIPMERIDDAVRRILRVKFAMGLMEPKEGPLTADPALAEVVGSDAHRAVAREAVRQSLVLLKNDGGDGGDGPAIPLAKDLARIHVAGSNADDLGNQCGGWTVQWQGASGPITEGTTILEAIRGAVSEGTEVTFAADGSGAEGADVAIVVVGETPYAEMMGDRTDLSLTAEDQAAVRNASAAGVPVVLVVVSGRPLILGDALEQSAAVVAAWLPGSEGEGVTDVLFGDHPPVGKLPFTWPRSVDQLPLNHGDEPYDPLFPFGFGLGG